MNTVLSVLQFGSFEIVVTAVSVTKLFSVFFTVFFFNFLLFDVISMQVITFQAGVAR